MTVLEIIVALFGLAALVAIPVYHFTDNFDLHDWCIGAMVIGALTVGAFFGVRFLVRAGYESGRNTCQHWGSNTNREVKWVYVGAGSHTCMTQTSDGKWIPVSQVREVAP